MADKTSKIKPKRLSKGSARNQGVTREHHSLENI